MINYLIDEELGNAFAEPPFLAAEDHLEHVAAQLLHHKVDAVGHFEHPLNVHNTLPKQGRMVE